MLMHEDKKALLTILRKRKEAGAPVTESPMKQESVKDEDGVPDGRLAAAQDAIAAFHEKSAEKLMGALGNFYDLHSMRKPDSDGDE